MGDSGGCCVHWSSTVQLKDGTAKRIDELRRGDIVKAVNDAGMDGFAKVECVVVTRVHTITMVHIGTLRVTPWHPIRLRSAWAFPKDAAENTSVLENTDVVSVVLEIGFDGLYVNGIAVASLGHTCEMNEHTVGCTHAKNAALMHPFFSNRARFELMCMAGFNSGRIFFRGNPLLRDAETGVVCGFDHTKQI